MGIRVNELANGGRSFTVDLRYRGMDDFRETYTTFEEALKEESEVKPKMREQARLLRASKFPKSKIQSAMETFMGRRVADVIVDYIDRKKANSLLKRNGKQGEGWNSHKDTVENALGELTVAEISPGWAKDYVARMRVKASMHGRPYTYSTIEKHFKLINAAVVDEAWNNNLTPPRLPFNTEKLFPTNWRQSRKRTLRPHEEVELRKAIAKFGSPTQPHWDPLLTLALETGARLQELVLAHWDEFDLDARVWSIPEVNVKTDAARDVPLSRKAVATLRSLASNKNPGSPRVLHLLGTPGQVSDQFRRSLAPSAALTNYHFHDHRHEATTRMRNSKKSKLDSAHVARILGHSEEVMRSTYDHTPAADLVDLLPS